MVTEKEMAPWYPSQLGSEMRLYRPLTDQKADGFLKYVVQREILEDQWESISSARKKKSTRRVWQKTCDCGSR